MFSYTLPECGFSHAFDLEIINCMYHYAIFQAKCRAKLPKFALIVHDKNTFLEYKEINKIEFCKNKKGENSFKLKYALRK